MPVCSKMISSWTGTVLSIVKGHVSPAIIQGAVLVVVFVAGVSLVSMLQAGDWFRVSTPPRYCFSTHVTATDQH